MHGVLNVFQKERPQYKRSVSLLRAYLDEYAAPLEEERPEVDPGPQYIVQDADEFLDWYLVRRIPRGLEMLPEAASMVADLCRWMADKGLVEALEARAQANFAVKAAGQIPLAQKLEVLLSEFTGTPPPGAVQDVLDSRFEIREVRPGRLTLVCQETQRRLPVVVQKVVSDNCRKGWKLTLLLEKRANQWQIREPGVVDPF